MTHPFFIGDRKILCERPNEDVARIIYQFKDGEQYTLNIPLSDEKKKGRLCEFAYQLLQMKSKKQCILLEAENKELLTETLNCLLQWE